NETLLYPRVQVYQCNLRYLKKSGYSFHSLPVYSQFQTIHLLNDLVYHIDHLLNGLVAQFQKSLYSMSRFDVIMNWHRQVSHLCHLQNQFGFSNLYEWIVMSKIDIEMFQQLLIHYWRQLFEFPHFEDYRLNQIEMTRSHLTLHLIHLIHPSHLISFPYAIRHLHLLPNIQHGYFVFYIENLKIYHGYALHVRLSHQIQVAQPF